MNMYDICVIGGGLVGKYIASKLQGKNIAWVSSEYPTFTSTQSYQLAQYLGRKDTWHEKAFGIISWPEDDDMSYFPVTLKKWQRYCDELREELNIKSLREIGASPSCSSAIDYLQKQFSREPLRYFESAHQTFSGPDFEFREAYGEYWMKQKPQWDFLKLKPKYFHAESFFIDRGKATSIHGYDDKGRRGVIYAKKFIVAAHTPGSIALLQNTYDGFRVNEQTRDLIGRGFSEHPQLSFGFLSLKQDIPRTSLPAICYQDYEVEGVRFRLEFHFTPPRKDLVELCLKRFPQYTADHFVKHFIRIAAVVHIPNIRSHRLYFLIQSGSLEKGQLWDNSSYKISSFFYKSLDIHKKFLVDYLQKEIFPTQDFVLLNEHFPWYFAGHVSGGAAYPDVLDERFFLHDLPNVAIASAAALATNGLFNPAMPVLACAKHVLSHIH